MLNHDGKIAQNVLLKMYADGKIGPLEYAIRLKAIEETYTIKEQK